MYKALLLSILLTIFASPALIALAQGSEPARPDQTSTALARLKSSPATTQGPFSTSTQSSATEEPLLLLLFGLAVFVGATTVKKRRSSLR